jgi:ribose transport system substrate-binding protein
VDGTVASGEAYVALTDQAALGRVGMEWLAERLGGEGAVVLVRSEGDAARRRGAERVLAANPGLSVAAEVASPAEVAELVQSGGAVDGVWAPGQDYLVVQALEAIGESGIPVVGVDNNEFLRQLRDGAPGAAVTNPAVVGAVGLTIALDVLDGLDRPRRTLLRPEVWTWPEDRDAIETSYDASLPPGYSVRISVEPYTHFSSDQLRACQAP